MRRGRVVIVLALLLLALLGLGLRGVPSQAVVALVFQQLHHGGALPVDLAPGVTGSLLLSPQWQTACHLPLRCVVTDAPPYDLKLQVSDSSRGVVRLAVTEIRVEQPGAPPRRLADGWSWALREAMHRMSGPGPDAVPELRLDAVIPAVVPLPADVALTLTGRLEHRGGAVTPFRMTQRFAIRAQRSSYSLGEVIAIIMGGV